MSHPTTVMYFHVIDRLILGCPCGRAVSLPRSGASRHLCACGIDWSFDGGEQIIGLDPADRSRT